MEELVRAYETHSHIESHKIYYVNQPKSRLKDQPSPLESGSTYRIVLFDLFDYFFESLDQVVSIDCAAAKAER